MKPKAVYITRSNLSASWITPHANVYLKPLQVATAYDTILCVPKASHVPSEIATRCSRIIQYDHIWSLPRLLTGELDGQTSLFTGFDFPSLFLARQLQKRLGCRWTLFLWDPPSLSHRDASCFVRHCIDFVWRHIARFADRLVLNIHPGILEEIGYKPPQGQKLELRMQDAFDAIRPAVVDERVDAEYDVGVLSNWTEAKGGDLVASVMRQMTGKTCLWIGDPPLGPVESPITFMGRMSQEEAFAHLKKCRVLLVPYLPVPSLKWNYPLKLFEYLELGRPIVASDNPGNAAVEAQFPNRIKLFESGNAESLWKVLRNLSGGQEKA